MDSKSDDKIFSEQFPSFNEREREILRNLLLGDANPSVYAEAKSQLLDVLYKDLVHYYAWDVSFDDRMRYRRRFLNVANIFTYVPIMELREISARAKKSLKKVVNEIAPDPFKTDPCEMHSYDLKYVEPFGRLLSQVSLEPNLTALDFITGNRNKRQYPHSLFTIFRKRLQDEIPSKNYLTASAEPLSQSVLISLYNADGTLRDGLTVGFDLIHESSYVHFFHNADQVTPLSLKRNSYLMGLNYLLGSYERLQGLLENPKNDLHEFPVFLEEKADYSSDRMKRFLAFLRNVWVPQVQEQIQKWNQLCGLTSDNYEIIWGLQMKTGK